MKKSLVLLISLTSSFALTACGGNSTKGHVHSYGSLIPEVSATCERQGVKAHYYCEGCDTYFDEDFYEINYENLIIPTTPHQYGDYSYNDNEHYRECTNGCDDRIDNGEHSSTGIMYFDETYHWNKCICGFVMNKAEHQPVDSTYIRAEGVDYHYRLCKCGQILDKSSHVFDKEIENEEFLDKSSYTCGQKPNYFKSCLCGAHGNETFISKTKPTISHDYKHSYNNDVHFEECTICHNKINQANHLLTSTVVTSGDFRGYELKKCNECEYEYMPSLTSSTFDNYVNYLTENGTTGDNPFDRRALEAANELYEKLPSSEKTQVTKKNVLEQYFTNYDSKYYVAYDMYQGNDKFSPESSSLYNVELAKFDDPIVGRYMNINVISDDAATALPGSITLDKIKQFKSNHLNKNPLSFEPKSLTLAVEASYNPRFISFTGCNWVFQEGTRIPGTNWYTYTLVGSNLDAFIFQYTRENCLYRFGKYENNEWSLPQESFKLSNFVFEF